MGFDQTVGVDELPKDGWWPETAKMCQWFRKDGRSMAQVVRQGAHGGWRAFSMIELNQSKTTGKPLGGGTSLEEAKRQCEEYAETR